MDQRTHDRLPVVFQVRVSELSTPEFSASGEAIDISESGIGVYLPFQFTPGSPVRLNIRDSVLCEFTAYSLPERSFFHIKSLATPDGDARTGDGHLLDSSRSAAIGQVAESRPEGVRSDGGGKGHKAHLTGSMYLLS